MPYPPASLVPSSVICAPVILSKSRMPKRGFINCIGIVIVDLGPLDDRPISSAVWQEVLPTSYAHTPPFIVFARSRHPCSEVAS